MTCEITYGKTIIVIELGLQKLTPADLSKRWRAIPLQELSRWNVVDEKGNRSIMGEVLAAAFSSNELLNSLISTINKDAATELVARTLGIPTLHAVLIDQVIWDHEINKKRRTENVNDVAINVLTNPEMYLGKNTPLIMDFGKQIDVHQPNQWQTIHSKAPDSFWEFEKQRELANQGYKQPDYDFGYHVGQHVAELALIRTGIVSKAPFKAGWQIIPGPSKISLRNVDEMLGLAINEIQSFGSSEKNPKLYFLPKFYDDKGNPLSMNWLRNHAA